MVATSNEYEQENTALARPRANQVARQDFSGSQLATQGAATDALVAKARADVEARWIIAQRNRRSLEDVRQDLLAECRRPSFARVAMYLIPRGGKQIDGLSIRYAEAAARCMGNIQPEVQTIYDSHATRIVKVTVTDYETNVTWSKDLNINKTVERKQLGKGQRPISERTNSYGDRVFIVEATDDDVNVKEAAMVSKAARTLILRLVPGHIQDECKMVIRQIAKDADAKDPNAAKTRALDAFAALGVKPSQIVEYLAKPIEQATREDWLDLSQLHNAIRDGEVTWADALADALERDQPAPARPSAPPQQPATQPANVPPATNGKPAEAVTTPPAEPAKKPTKGAAALKASIAKPAPEQPKPEPASDPREAEPGWMSGGTKETPEPEQAPQTPTTTPTAAPPPGMEERNCKDCGVPIDVPIESEPGQKCYACQQA